MIGCEHSDGAMSRRSSVRSEILGTEPNATTLKPINKTGQYKEIR